MSTVLFGVGRQGYRILELLINEGISPIYIFDINENAVKSAENEFPGEVIPIKDNPLDQNEELLINFLSRFKLIVDALPATYSYKLLKSSVKTGAGIVSVSFLEEDFMQLNDEAKKSGSILIPDCGAAPGFSHMMSGYSSLKLENTKKVIMKLGAVPKEPVAPFNHSFTWSIDDLMEEYIRPAKIKINGQPKSVNPFDTIEEENIKGIDFHSFITDGVRSFTDSYPDIPTVEERTLRHFGHLDFMRNFKDSGFLTKEIITYDGKDIVPYLFLSKILDKQFSDLPKEDMFIMHILIENEEERHVHYYQMDYDHISGTFGLVNAVAVTAVECAKFILNNQVTEAGVFPLELLATEDLFNQMVDAHRKYGAIVELNSTLI